MRNGVQTTYVDPALLRGRATLLGSASMGMTIEQAGNLLLGMRESLSALWPWFKANTKQLSKDEMRAWNLAVWSLIDAEIRYVRELSKLGIRTEAGVPLAKALDANVLYKRLQVGMYADSGPLGIVPVAIAAAVLPWLVLAAGIVVFVWAGAGLIEDAIRRISSALHPGEAEALQQANKIVEDIRLGKAPAKEALKAQLDLLAAHLKLEEIRRRFPAWAKGAAVVGAVLVVGLAIWKFAPVRTA